MDKNKNKKSTLNSLPLGEQGTTVLVIDNYDSFTYNLVHYLEDLGCRVTVKRNDQLTLEEVDAFDKIVLSPGPGLPDEAGLLKEIIKTYAPTKSIFGVCLGQQAIGEVFGGSLVNLDQVHHGVATKINIIKDDILFDGLPREIEVGRYHSWVVNPNLPCPFAIKPTMYVPYSFIPNPY